MKKFIIIASVLILIVFLGLIYLNKFFLPKKIKSIIISTLTQQTRKDVRLGSVEFNIFKGLVLRDLVIADGQNVILSTREANCGVFIWPILKKQIIIPSINLKGPYIFLERLKDGTFNLQDIFVSRQPVVKISNSQETKSKKSEFNVSVYKINISSGSVVFQDDTLAVPFKKEIRGIQLSLGLALPASVKFNFKGELANNPPTLIYSWGEYRILKKELVANLSVNNLLPKDFEPYYASLGINLLSGAADGKVKLNLKEQLLYIEASLKATKLVLAKEKIKASLNLGLDSKVDYNLQTKKVSFDGVCDIQQADISGLDFFGELKNFYGKVAFNERSLVAQGLKAEILGIP
ncbi:MAG: AsmA family protein, partial [Candidatus Omnitrophica bacterium]|nr:AsmA family protein [Candidatus Omnitrophota bacterium]